MFTKLRVFYIELPYKMTAIRSLAYHEIARHFGYKLEKLSSVEWRERQNILLQIFEKKVDRGKTPG